MKMRERAKFLWSQVDLLGVPCSTAMHLTGQP